MFVIRINSRIQKKTKKIKINELITKTQSKKTNFF